MSPIDALSLCMIVRNEASRLERCLASALPWVGEAIVVDTGSTDGTDAIAERMGARLLRFAWRDDFAAARNFALEAATRPWALVLDADEVLVVKDAERLVQSLSGAEADAYALECHDRLDGGGVAVAPILRLFRRDRPDMRYRGELHEQIVAVAERRVVPARATFAHIEHDGYTQAVMAEHKTHERNVALARRLVTSRAEDPFAWFSLGSALAACGQVGDAVGAFERAVAVLEPTHRDESYVVGLWVGLVRGLIHTGRTREALRRVNEALADFEDSPDLRFLRGKLRLDAGTPEAALPDFEACLSPAARAFFVRQDPGAASYAAWTQLAFCRLKMGQPERAEQALRSAVASAPDGFALPRLVLGALLVARGAAREAELLLAATVNAHPREIEPRVQLARALLAQGRRTDARAVVGPVEADPRVAALFR